MVFLNCKTIILLATDLKTLTKKSDEKFSSCIIAKFPIVFSKFATDFNTLKGNYKLN